VPTATTSPDRPRGVPGEPAAAPTQAAGIPEAVAPEGDSGPANAGKRPTVNPDRPDGTPAADQPAPVAAALPESAPGGAPAGTPPTEGPTATPSTEAGAKPPAPAAAKPVAQFVTPQALQAPDADVQQAKMAKPVEQKPDPAPRSEVADLVKAIDLKQPSRDPRDDLRVPGGPDRPRDLDGPGGRQVNAASWDRNVRQWSPDWVTYDQYYRPVIANPYRDPVRVVYMYQNAPRVVIVPPLQSVVMEVAQLAAYSFTAVVVNAVDTAVNVAVGSFFGGGYLPAVGMPLPPPPPPVMRYDNVPVQVRYSQATYEPFLVHQVVDAGLDPQYGERKVLLDGATPVWGQWVENPSGERQFEVHKTQQYPGLDSPQEAPLPGDYRLQLAAASAPMSETNKYLAIVAATAAGLSLGLVGLSVYIGRRRRALY
jgi:hypothetical protein